MAGGEELLVLIDNEIPEGRKSLQENYMNLENVAKYCEENYQKVSTNRGFIINGHFPAMFYFLALLL